MNLPWMRWWDEQGNMLLMGHELAERERKRIEKMAAKLRELGVDPNAL